MNNELLDLARSRYSCRAYLDKPVEEEKLEYIKECMRLAPSAVNRQPWRFRLVTGDDLKKLCTTYRREWLQTAPACIIASVLHDEEWTRFDGKAHGNIDIAIAVEHLCLAAAEQGLGTCWVCNFDAALCKELFSLGDNEEAAVLIPIGYPADSAKEKSRKALDEIFIQR